MQCANISAFAVIFYENGAMLGNIIPTGLSDQVFPNLKYVVLGINQNGKST